MGIYFLRYFNVFLMTHSRETAEEVRSDYVDTLSKIYFSYFKDYYNKLMKLQVRRGNSDDSEGGFSVGSEGGG